MHEAAPVRGTSDQPVQRREGGSGGARDAMKVQLRGSDYAAGAAMLEPVQRKRSGEVQKEAEPKPGAQELAGAGAQDGAGVGAQEGAGAGAQGDVGAGTGGGDGEAKARIAQLNAAYGRLVGMSATDPEAPKVLGLILGPLGVTVEKPAPGDPRSAGQLMASSVQAGKAAAIGKFPAETVIELYDSQAKKKVVLKSKQPTTLGECNELLSRIQMEKAVKGRDAAPHAAMEADCFALNKILGLEQLAASWNAMEPEAQKREAPGAAAASFALGCVGMVSTAEWSGQMVEAPDISGRMKKVKACKGHQLLLRIWKEGCTDDTIRGEGGEAGIIDCTRQKRASWCGIFANWVLIQTGLASAKWVTGGKGLSWTNKSLARESVAAIKTGPAAPDPKPGDVGYASGHNHHYCIVLRADGDSVHTIDGNTSPGGGSTGGQILAQTRARTWHSNFYEWK
jgi:hypothetical protein